MKKNNKLPLLFLIIICAFSIIFTSIEMRYWGHVQMELSASKVGFAIGLISTLMFWIFLKKKKWLLKLGITCFLLSLLINVNPMLQYYENLQKRWTLEKYQSINSCDQMKEQFKVDVANDELKYFQFGIGFDFSLKENLDKNYNIESFGMGCIIQSNLECYNKLLSNYLKEEYNTTINKIYEQSQTLLDLSEY